MRKLATKRVDRDQAGAYLEKARGFLVDAETMVSLAEFSGNGVSVVAVHAAIAFADAVGIRAREIKSTGGDHTDAIDVLQNALGRLTDADRAALRDLRYVLQRKDEVSYTANLVSSHDATLILSKLRSFANWAETRYSAL